MIGRDILFTMNTRMAAGEQRPGKITYCYPNGTYDAVIFTRGGQDGVRDFIMNASRISHGDGPEQFRWLDAPACPGDGKTTQEEVHAVHVADTATLTENVG